jgi:hypothetical protein
MENISKYFLFCFQLILTIVLTYLTLVFAAPANPHGSVSGGRFTGLTHSFGSFSGNHGFRGIGGHHTGVSAIHHLHPHHRHHVILG